MRPIIHYLFVIGLCLLCSRGAVAEEQPPSETLPQEVWATRDDHVPISDERLAEVRDELRSAAQALEQAIGVDTPFAQNWKDYLLWDLLVPHRDAEMRITGKSLGELDRVLKRFRKNHPGLELPQFTRTAAAIERYREIAFWYVLGQRRDTRSYYAKNLRELEKQLTRNLEAPSVESSRLVGKMLGMIDDLGHSPGLVSKIRSQFSRPNVTLQISEEAINRLAQRPVSEVETVRDCILGATVQGTASSTGEVTFCTYPAEDHIEMEVQLAGHIHSTTNSYKKPVVVSSRGLTHFVATKRLLINDEQFAITPALARAHTKTRTCSIKKTGGEFGRRLIERIARKKVAKSKPKAQRIASRHAEQRIAAKFDKQLAEVITDARRNYDRKVRPPLVRVGMFPEYLRMASDPGGVNVEATLASYKQISTAELPPKLPLQDDMTVQIHETAANNFSPVVLAGVTIQQDEQDQPPRLEGDVPSWLKTLTEDEELSHPVEEPVEPSEDFKPWAFKLNADHPVSVSFDDQKFTVRIRIAELKTIEDGEEKIRKNWDFLITYRVVQQGNSLLIRREGDIQALPTGFDPQWFGDPRWKDSLDGEQVSVRRNLEKNLNKRAESGEGFPKEINVPPVKLPTPGGGKQTLVLQQFDCDDGWLTLGYRLP
ncbi:MAG: hypothetical protein MI725_16105 [Pirellulales bacterium]|nr:hypothetical protein [Pirellulales bacterium]